MLRSKDKKIQTRMGECSSTDEAKGLKLTMAWSIVRCFLLALCLAPATRRAATAINRRALH